ncbi:DMT family transporter [Acidaminococcus timonensis]|jgi:drug/metabolite transporter (DMT)-like permease|uniref:DMT family transporter n=1 Tax=Acidaminococcus timonensis TaxID=1871002 RepID=UPI003A5C638E
MGLSTTTKGILASMLAAFFFTTMDVGAKTLIHLGTGEITFFRGLLGLLALPLLARREGLPVFSGKDRLLLHLRGFFGCACLLFFFYCLQGLKLGDAEILTQLSAFFMCLLSPLFLKAELGQNVVPRLIMIAAGAAIVLQVWNFSSFNVFAIFGILSALFAAAAYVCIGRLTERGGHSQTELVYYFQVYSMLGGLVLMAGGQAVWPRGTEWLWIVELAASALLGQVSLTWSCTHIHPTIMNFVMYTGILFHILAGYLLWGEQLSLYSWVGGALIVVGSILLILRKQG